LSQNKVGYPKSNLKVPDVGMDAGFFLPIIESLPTHAEVELGCDSMSYDERDETERRFKIDKYV
jgi:hypothetical protein